MTQLPDVLHARCGFPVVFALTALLAVPAFGQNDDCADATDISGTGTATGNTSSASNDGAGGCNSSTAPDVWYRYTSDEDGVLMADLCGSSYDTVISIWTGCPGDGGAELTCNDDSCGLQSATSFPILEGQSLYIRVSGWSGNSGPFTMSYDVQAGGGGTTGPDVIYSDIQAITNWGQVGDIRAYSLGSYTCNIGDMNMAWNNSGPLLAMNAYRLMDGRLEQIGLGFVKNATVAAAGSGCGLPCNGQGGSVLGAGCLDVYGASYNGGFGVLGPRSNVNPYSGAYPGPSGGSGNAIYKRLQVRTADLDAKATFFVEGHYVAADDAAFGNAMNNASYKQVSVSGASFDMTPVGSMYQEEPCIYAWRDHGLGIGVPDPSVEVVEVHVPDEGRFDVAAKVTDLGNGTYRYDYAVRNFNSHQSADGFSVPLPAGANVTNVGFHDVDYHSGEPYDNTDWDWAVAGGAITWSSPESYEQNQNTNALRWGTMYNFWFELDAAPVDGTVAIDLFRPGATASITAPVAVPDNETVDCAADVNGDGMVNVEDLVDVILAWASDDADADVNDDGVVDVQDLVEVILNWGPCS